MPHLPEETQRSPNPPRGSGKPEYSTRNQILDTTMVPPQYQSVECCIVGISHLNLVGSRIQSINVFLVGGDAPSAPSTRMHTARCRHLPKYQCFPLLRFLVTLQRSTTTASGSGSEFQRQGIKPPHFIGHYHIVQAFGETRENGIWLLNIQWEQRVHQCT